MEFIQEKKIVLVSFKKLSNELIAALNKSFRMISYDSNLHFSKTIDEIGQFELLYIHLNMDSYLRKNMANLHWLNRQETKAYNLVYVYKDIKHIDIVECPIKIRKLLIFNSKKEFYTIIINRVQAEIRGETKDEELSVVSCPASPRKMSINLNDTIRSHPETKLISLNTIQEIQEQYDRLQDSLFIDNETVININQELKEQQAENKDLTDQYISVFQNLSETKELLKSQSELINSKENEIKALKEQFEKLQKNNQDTIDKLSEKTNKILTPAPPPKRRIVRINTSKDNLIEVISDGDIYSYPYIEKEQKSKALAEALRKKAEILSNQ